MKINRIDIKGNLYDVEAFLSPIPVGTVLPFAGITAPKGFLFCDGSAVLRTAYPKLLGVIGETYGRGDGSTTFNLPDYRETVLVGAGQNEKLNIKEHDVYNIGEFKDDQMQGHKHSITMFQYKQGTKGPAGSYFDFSPSDTSDPVDDGVNGTPRTGSTTHGKQIGVNYIIKY